MNYIKESINELDLINEIKKESFFERVALFIWGTLLYAVSFTVFFEPNEIVTGGSSGLGQIINAIIPINISTFVLIFSSIIQIISFLTLGFKQSMKTLMGVIMLPVFLTFSTSFTRYIDLTNSSLFLVSVFGAIVMGFSSGIILKSGFSVGGFQTIYQIMHKYLKLSIGKASLITNGLLIVIGGFFFGFDKAIYAFIALYIGSVITDKVLLGISECKTFYIVTDKDEEVNQFISDNLGHDATIIDARGGYSNDKKKVLMCAVPTRQYYLMKEIVENIDENSFFVATDTYEIYGGK